MCGRSIELDRVVISQIDLGCRPFLENDLYLSEVSANSSKVLSSISSPNERKLIKLHRGLGAWNLLQAPFRAIRILPFFWNC